MTMFSKAAFAVASAGYVSEAMPSARQQSQQRPAALSKAVLELHGI